MYITDFFFSVTCSPLLQARAIDLREQGYLYHQKILIEKKSKAYHPYFVVKMRYSQGDPTCPKSFHLAGV